jgi:hypothetical protein
MNLDEELRGALHAHAQDAPDGANTLAAVRPKLHRLARRRRLGYGSVAAFLAVAVAITGPYLLASARSGRSVADVTRPNAAPTSPSASPTPATLVTPSIRTSVPLAAAAFTPVSFPLTPGFVPAGLGQPTAGRNQVQLYLFYVGDSAGLTMFVGRDLGAAPWPPVDSRPATVNGHPATISSGKDDQGRAAVRITWRLSDGRWADLQTVGLSATDAQRFADRLRAEPMTTPLPFTVALAPQGYQVIFQEVHPELSPIEAYFTLAPASYPDDLDTALGVFQAPDLAGSTGGQPLTVGGYPARLTIDKDGVRLIVLRPGFAYGVHEAVTGPLSVEDLIRFATGIAPA